MSCFSLETGKDLSAVHSGARSSTWFLLDVAMTLVMLGLTSVFVGTLAMSMS